jgi:hypothetical protein
MLTRERWGAFAVRDHVSHAPFVTDVLLYDRLIIPIPDPVEPSGEADWAKNDWQPELQRKCRRILNPEKAEEDWLAFEIPWGSEKRERFKDRMNVAAGVATQAREPGQGYYVDPSGITRQLLKTDFLPALPRGVSKAWTVAAYPSIGSYEKELSKADENRSTRLATKLVHRFLAPGAPDPHQEMLKRAADLARTKDFCEKRAAFYRWQEDIIEQDISDEKAMEELEQRLRAYNKAVEKAFANARLKYVLTLIPVALGLAGAIGSYGLTGLAIGGTAGLAQLTRFCKFDRKPVIDSGELDAAAMIHDATDVVSVGV